MQVNIGMFNTLRRHFCPRLRAKFRAHVIDDIQRLRVQHMLQALRAMGANIRQPHAIGRQKRGKRMNQHRFHR